MDWDKKRGEHIYEAELTSADVPGPTTHWEEIEPFAYSFRGFHHWESCEKCGEIANRILGAYLDDGSLPDSLTDLRTALFFEQRRWKHFGVEPDEPSMIYIHALVEAIRGMSGTVGSVDWAVKIEGLSTGGGYDNTP